MSDITKLFFQDKRRGLELEQLRAQFKHLSESVAKLRSDMESLRAKTGSVEAGNMPQGNPVLGAVPETMPK